MKMLSLVFRSVSVLNIDALEAIAKSIFEEVGLAQCYRAHPKDRI